MTYSLHKLLGIASVPALCLALSAQAGQLQLANGDVISGELVSIVGDTVIWKSDVLGELTIKKGKIAQVKSTTALKVNGHNLPCHITGLQGETLSYDCEDGDAVSISFATLDNVQPFKKFAAGHYEYEGKLAIAGVYSDGNKDEEDWDVSTSTSYRRGDFRHITSIDYESEAIDGGPTIEEHKLLYRLDWFIKEKWFWYNEVATGGDESKNIDEYYQFGSGVGYQVWNNSQGFLDIELGLDYIKENYDPTADDLLDPDYEDKDEHTSLRYATDFKRNLDGFAKAVFIHTNELLYSLEDSKDWELLTETGINIPLGAGLFSKFVLEYDYDNKPSGENKKGDTTFTVGVGYQW